MFFVKLFSGLAFLSPRVCRLNKTVYAPRIIFRIIIVVLFFTEFRKNLILSESSCYCYCIIILYLKMNNNDLTSTFHLLYHCKRLQRRLEVLLQGCKCHHLLLSTKWLMKIHRKTSVRLLSF